MGKRAGLEVPFLRPAELAQDSTGMLEVALHLLAVMSAEGYEPDALMVLQPPSPLRRPDHIRRAIQMLESSPQADSVCSVYPLPKDLCPHYLVKIQDGRLEFFMPDGARYTRRQDVPQAWKRDGTVFLTRTTVLREQRSFYGRYCLPLELSPHEALNIDEPQDWEEAERRLRAVAVAGGQA